MAKRTIIRFNTGSCEDLNPIQRGHIAESAERGDEVTALRPYSEGHGVYLNSFPAESFRSRKGNIQSHIVLDLKGTQQYYMYYTLHVGWATTSRLSGRYPTPG